MTQSGLCSAAAESSRGHGKILRTAASLQGTSGLTDAEAGPWQWLWKGPVGYARHSQILKKAQFTNIFTKSC